MSREDLLEGLGYPLDRIPKAAANYLAVVAQGTNLYVSGCLPFDGPGNLVSQGQLGRDISLEQGQAAAALAAANILRVVRLELGTLDRVVRVLRLGGYVNSTSDFTLQHLVLNGASDLLVQVLGPEAGSHARSAIGVAQLPLGASVEVDAILEIRTE